MIKSTNGSKTFNLDEAKKSEVLKIGEGVAKFYFFDCDDCENEIKARKSDLLTKKSRLCKKCSDSAKLKKAREIGNCNRSKPYEALYNNLKKQTRRRKIKLGLTYTKFLVFTKIKKCHYCLSDIKWTKYNIDKNGSRINLDRKDNKMGYIEENLVVCCWKCNNAKSDKFSYKDWYGMTEYFRRE